MDRPRKGDKVAWMTGGQGEIVSLHEAQDFTLVAGVKVAGWFWDEQAGCFTRRDTGTPGVLEIDLRDLSRREGE